MLMMLGFVHQSHEDSLENLEYRKTNKSYEYTVPSSDDLSYGSDHVESIYIHIYIYNTCFTYSIYDDIMNYEL